MSVLGMLAARLADGGAITSDLASRLEGWRGVAAADRASLRGKLPDEAERPDERAVVEEHERHLAQLWERALRVVASALEGADELSRYEADRAAARMEATDAAIRERPVKPTGVLALLRKYAPRFGVADEAAVSLAREIVENAPADLAAELHAIVAVEDEAREAELRCLHTRTTRAKLRVEDELVKLAPLLSEVDQAESILRPYSLPPMVAFSNPALASFPAIAYEVGDALNSHPHRSEHAAMVRSELTAA